MAEYPARVMVLHYPQPSKSRAKPVPRTRAAAAPSGTDPTLLQNANLPSRMNSAMAFRPDGFSLACNWAGSSAGSPG